MQVIKTRGNLETLAGEGVARGMYRARDKKTGRVSLWNNTPRGFTLKDCKY